jgi:hypothetical protein
MIENKKRANIGVVEALMKQLSEKFNVSLSLLKRDTLKNRSRTTRTLLCTHRGPLYTMHTVEAHVLKTILILGAMHQPASCANGLALANSLIGATVSHMQLIEGKKQHLGKIYREET